PTPAGPSPLPALDVNLMIDGYYGYNFNRPAGRVNLLRAYDVLSNSFSLNQAVVMVERPPDPANGRRFGARLDLQFGQATETLAGNSSNELRPQVYRNIFQAYGTYVAPLGRGLTVDFGKWASALGFENNYTKDQFNYSRSYFFNFLPFYHSGVRTTYNFTDNLSASYWLVNGAQQSEDFNGSKSQAVDIVWKPVKPVTWTLNYYTGNENPDVAPLYNPGPPVLATQPGLSGTSLIPALQGRTHILDTYASWNVTGKLTLAAEADYVIRRYASHGAPSRVTGGAAYAHYQFGKFGLGGRAEYLNDHGGMFSGTTQVLKETTFTADYLLASGFLIRGEWRRDFSNRPFFLTDLPNLLKKEQNTATLGLIWWFGPHPGAW
ncbi:MAG TPA: outer membrane beta-barrel protein, partial [Bryobacteraceae bacterium]